jgi:pimeloyl-ACP methyl ester carboxylesterase
MNNIVLQRKSIQLSNVTTGFLDSGEGETIVALHGIPTSSLLFSPLLPLLGRYRIIAPDLLGQGHTGTPPAGMLDYAAYAGHLREFMEAVPPRRFHLLVHDLGGVLGLDWATENAERIKSLIILSTTLTGSVRVGKLLYAANLIFGQSLLRWGMQSTLKRPHKLDAALMDEWVRPWSRRRILRGMDHFASRRLQLLRAKLDCIRVPTLVIWGEQDNVFPLHHASSIAQVFPHANIRTISGCGHWSPLDAPEEIAQFMLEFFEDNGFA